MHSQNHRKYDRILLNLFRDYPNSPCYLKEGNLVGAEKRGPRPSSDKDCRIYRLAVLVLK